MLALLIISLAVALPKVREDIQRDREVETMERGKQYIRGIKMYYKKFHAYPPNIDALVKTNEIRFLRKRYVDPITGKDDWKPILFGQNKQPVAYGFFGQPLAGSTLAGTGPGGVAGASPIAGGDNGASIGSFGNSGSFGSNSFSGGSSTPGGGSMFGSSSSGTTTGAAGAAGTGTGTTGTGGTDQSSGGSFSSNQTFGGGGIIGFSPASQKQSILVYKKKNHYNEWEFVYSPLVDQMMQGGNAGTIGQPVGGTTGNGNGNGITGNGVTGGFPNNPGGATPVAPTSPRATGFGLDAEGRTAAAGRLDLGVLELEACRLKSFNVIDGAAIEVHERCGIDEDL
jgi:type II secretory pathway pseudopilin PulG